MKRIKRFVRKPCLENLEGRTLLSTAMDGTVTDWIVDDGDADYSSTPGRWTTEMNFGGSGGDTSFAAAGDGSAQANWQFAALPAASYDVSATWTAYANR